MRKFICSPFGEEVDLDNDKTFDYLPNNIKDLRKVMFEEIGFCYCYFNIWHTDWYQPQVEKVNNMIKEFAENEKNNYKNLKWYKEQVFLFQDEIENMC